MQYYTDYNSYHENARSAVTIGKFESLHRGHQKLIKAMQRFAEEEKLISVVLAFDMGKNAVLTNEERRAALENKTDCLIQHPFTDTLRQMEAGNFIEEVLVKKLRAAHIIVGTDFRFGYKAQGDVDMLKKYQSVYQYKLAVIDKEVYNGCEISSTYVRGALEAGDIGLANELLGYPYYVSGTVSHGKMLGRRLGFPTINVIPSPRKLIPGFGVYTCKVQIDGIWYCGIGNIGVKPTVSDKAEPAAEIFMFDYKGNAYGKNVTVEFCTFRRQEMKFCSLDKLKQQVDSDIEFGLSYFSLR